MNLFTRHRRVLVSAGVFLAVVLVVGGIWLVIGRDGGGTSAPPDGQPTTSPTAAPTITPTVTATPAMMTVKVYFHRLDSTDRNRVFAVSRTVRRSPAVAAAAIGQLLAGPTSAERDDGYWSHFSAATAGRLRTLRIGNGVAHADFLNFSPIIPIAGSSIGATALLGELDATLKQFTDVRATVYSFSNDLLSFYGWLGLVPPDEVIPTAAQAGAVARDFMARVVGLPNPVDGLFRLTDMSGSAEVEVRPATGGAAGGSGPVTTVSLHRDAKTWTVTGTRTDTIRVTSPVSAQAIPNPLRVDGQALAWEGKVRVRILQADREPMTELARSYVLGGGDILRPFSAYLPFQTPTSSRGWVVFTSDSGSTGEIIAATAVPVTFAELPAPPRVLSISTTPGLSGYFGLWADMYGAGSVRFTVQAIAASRMQFFLTPLGTSPASPPILLGTATKSGDQFVFTWSYADEPMLARMSAVLSGPGGSTEHVLYNIYHR